jgi:peptidoglycan/LPS O-acetylase OafA/YrhL
VLDGLRGVAILLVIVYHLLTQLEGHPGVFHYAVIAGRLGWSGVDLFFVLSGFLIGGILLDARTSSRYYPTFYARRAFRILPIYGVLLFFFGLRSLLFRWMPGYSPNLTADEIPLLAYLTFSQNFRMAHLGSLGTGSLCPTWSLAVEEQFYLTMPVFIRNIKRERLVGILLAVVVGAPLLRILPVHFLQECGHRVVRVNAVPCRRAQPGRAFCNSGEEPRFLGIP